MPYITRLLVENCRNVRHLDLDLKPSGNEGREFLHLILTGPNGTGKSGVLEAVAAEIANDIQNGPDHKKGLVLGNKLSGSSNPGVPAPFEKWLRDHPATITWSGSPHLAPLRKDGWFTIWMPALRQLKPGKVNGPQRWLLADHTQRNPAAPVASFFLQYLVNLKTEQAFAGVDKDQSTVERLERWFDDFRRHVGFIVGDPDLRLDFDRTRYDFTFTRSDGYRFDLQQLSDGASSVLSILAELLIRADECRKQQGDPAFQPEGVVIIDEIEAHLHLKLQEAILPFLTELFPRVQFIVATHSPAVIASIPGAVVHDLGSKETRRSEEFQGKSYGTLMTGHFGTKSDVDLDTTEKLARYQELAKKPASERSAEEESERKELHAELSARSDELAVKLWLADGSPEEAAQ